MGILKVLFIICLFSFVFGETIRVPFSQFEIKLLDMSVFLIFAYFLAFKMLKKDFSRIIFLPIFLFSISGFISLVFNFYSLNTNQFIISASYLLRFLSYASILMIVSSFDKKFKERLKFLFIVLGTVIVFLGYVQFIFYQNLRNLYYLNWDEHLYRMFSVFLDPNFAGAFFVLFFVFLINFIFENYKNKKLVILSTFISLATLLAVLLTYSRSAFIMLVVGMTVFLFLKKKMKYLLAGIFTLMILTLVLPRAYVTEGTNFLRTASSEARIGSYSQAITIFKDNPVLGIGFNAYKFAKIKYGFTNAGTKSHADAGNDNSFLFVLATCGVIGFGFFMFMWYKIFMANREYPLIISSVVALFVNSLFVNSLFYVFFLFWIWSLMGFKENK